MSGRVTKYTRELRKFWDSSVLLLFYIFKQ